MNQASESLLTRFRALNLPQLLNRYLTPISIGVLAVGLLVVVLGPVRSLAAPGGAPGSASTSRTGQQSAPGLASPGEATIDQLDRSLVPFTTIPDRPRKNVVSYTIKSGDTLFAIAGEFSLKPETIFWSNKATLRDDIHLIFPGVTIAILPVNGVYYISNGTQTIGEIASQYKVDPNDILNSQYNHLAGLTPNDTPSWGTPVVIPGGTSTIISWQSPITATVNARTGVAEYGFMQGMAGSCSSGIRGGGGVGAWISPISPGGYTVTQPFAPWHSGIDLAAVLGTPVVASDTGVVIYAGWVPDSWGYGQLVVLDHGNGWTTYYAHLNSISARCGETIQRGEVLGAVGQTGHATGPHVHFEMRWQHTPDNPAAYVSF